jgi:VanZ family protein
MRDELRFKAPSGQLRNIALGIAVLGLLGLVQFSSPSHADLWWQTFYNTLHFPVFGLVSVCLLFITPPFWHWSKRLIVTLCSILALSILSEIAQIPLPNRSVSVGDLFNDWAGALAFLCVAFVLAPGFPVPAGRGRYLLIAALLLTIWPLKPLIEVSATYWERYRQLPSIAPLHSSHSRMFYYLKNAHVIYRRTLPGEVFATEVRFIDRGASSINFHDPW